MGFITSKRSSQLTNTLPKIKSTSGKSYPSRQLNGASRSQRKNEELDLLPRKKSHAVFNESEIEDIDLEKQLKIAQEMTKGSDCMWLSSDCNSLSSLVSDRSGEIWELGGSNLSPNGDFLMGGPSLKDLSVYGSSCSSLNTLDDSTCSICESDRTSTWISSLDVTPEGNQFVQQKNDEVDFSYSDFSSPSHNSKRNSQFKISLSSSNSTNYSHLLKASRSSSREFSEPDKSCLSISPRKNGRTARTKEINVLKSDDSKLRKTNSIPASRNIMQRPDSSQTPKKSTKTLVLSGKSTRKSTPATLHLSRSPQLSSRLVLCKSSTKESNSCTKKESHQLKVQKQTHKQEELPKKHLLELEDSHLQESLIEGVSIEKLIGLDEFDGHEGLNADFREEFHFHL